MYVPRASILRRPTKTEAGKANQEHADVEWAKEQARLQAKAERVAATEERLVTAFYATNEERRQAWSHAQREAEQHAAARAAALAREQQREAAWLSQPQQVVIDTQRPWSANSSTYYMPPAVEQAARRRGQAEAADINRFIAQRRAAEGAQQRALEQDALRRDLQAEETWFNRGAASERWIPPERRIRQRAAPPPQFAPQRPPYYCDNDDASSTTSSFSAAPARAPPQRPATASRRAQEGQGVAAALRHDDAPQPKRSSGIGSGGQGSAKSDSNGRGAAVATQARPQTAPAQQQQAPQRQYPWSWAA